MGKTVFVLGAGASCEVGLPDGNDLKKNIAEMLTVKVSRGAIERADERMLAAFEVLSRTRGGGLNPLLTVARDIVANMPHQVSIDNFIDMRNDGDIEILSKLAIARCILRGERASHLAGRSNRPDTVDIEKMPDTWFGKFAQTLTVGTRKETIGKRLARVAFVIFNYDRCFEQYLHAAFIRFLGVDDTTAASFVAAMEIYHPYGQVGRLRWELMGTAPWNRQDAGPGIGFGDESLQPEKLLEVSGQLRTFTEERATSELEHIRRLMSEAHRIVFLGFAFHEQNMKVLFDGIPPVNKPRVFGTVYKVPPPDRSDIEQKLRALKFDSRIAMDLDDAKCGPFLEARKRVLAFTD